MQPLLGGTLAVRELGLLRSLGRLTPGPPQVPPAPSYTEPLLQEAWSLPVWDRHQQILDTIQQHQVILICGETGSGKTTQVSVSTSQPKTS